MVFIGGVVGELLQLVAILPKARPTDDVDAIIGVTSENDYRSIAAEVKKRGFKEDSREGTHRFRWIGPTGEVFDLVPAQIAGNQWDRIALIDPIVISLGATTVRHVRAPVFLAMKWSAFSDRGSGDWMASRDFEDMVAVIASRPNIVAEIAQEVIEVRAYLAQAASTMVSTPDIESYVLGAVSNSLLAQDVIRSVIERLEIISRVEAITHPDDLRSRDRISD
jgi:hypothetical protein